MRTALLLAVVLGAARGVRGEDTPAAANVADVAGAPGGLRALKRVVVAPPGAVNSENGSGGNNPVCAIIKDLWWDLRQWDIIRNSTVVMDDDCATFNGDKRACESLSERAGYSSLTPSQKSAMCTMLGGHSDKCIANSCNQLNEGSCTVQDTGGLCIWWKESDVLRLNAHHTKIGSSTRYKGRGCYRNPCHAAGTGKMSNKQCEDNSVPGLIQCTYCSGGKDPSLARLGIGCQATMVKTEADCAPINLEASRLPKSSIFVSNKNPNCQCSNLFPFCQGKVSGKISGKGGEVMKPRFG
jgi:hypothetical protein